MNVCECFWCQTLMYVDVVFLWRGDCLCSKASCSSRCQDICMDKLCVCWDLFSSSQKAIIRLLPLPLIFILSPDLTPDDPILQEEDLLRGCLLEFAGFLLCRYLSKRLMCLFPCFHHMVLGRLDVFSLSRRKRSMTKNMMPACAAEQLVKVIYSCLVLEGMVKESLDVFSPGTIDWGAAETRCSISLISARNSKESMQRT